MKAPRRNIANENARREKLAQGKPKLSKYEAKRRRCADDTPVRSELGEILAEVFARQDADEPRKSLTGTWAVDFGDGSND